MEKEYFFCYGIPSERISDLIKTLTMGEISQFTKTGHYWNCWGTYPVSNMALLARAVEGYCLRLEFRKTFQGRAIWQPSSGQLANRPQS